MSSSIKLPTIATVWRLKDMVAAISETASLSKSTAIFDISAEGLDSAISAIIRAGVDCDNVDFKISPTQLLDPTLEAHIGEIEPAGLWVELVPVLLDKDISQYLSRISELSSRGRCCPVVGAIDLIQEIIANYPDIREIALKGNESSGLTSPETIFSLYPLITKLSSKPPHNPDLLIWGGIATPEAAAAFLASGAKGVILESVHWLTDLVNASETARAGLSKMRPEHTDLIGLNLDVPCRFFNRGNSRSVKKMRELSSSLCGAEASVDRRRTFAKQVDSESVHPLDSGFSADELLPLGVEATFAGSFVKRFGFSSSRAIEGFISETDRLCKLATQAQHAFKGNTLASEIGAKYPFVQGAMTWITDCP